MRTQKEIDDQIKRLEAVKPKVPARTAFGDDNYAAIDAQIVVLRDSLDADDIYNQWDDDESHAQDIAIQTMYWRDGASNESPAEGWEEIWG